MKIYLMALVLMVCGFTAQASSASCNESSVTLGLDLDVLPQCELLKIEGNYKIKLCGNDQGLLSGEDDSVRFLFKDQGSWVARQDILDFTNQISTTEIFRLDSQLSNFTISKIKAKQDGTVLDKFECSGVVEITQ